MKKFFSLITLVLLFSCAKEADVPVQLEQPVQEALTYTLSVPAGKDTKALNIDGTALKATWAEGETVRVFRGELLLGTLTAQTAGQSTTQTGTTDTSSNSTYIAWTDPYTGQGYDMYGNPVGEPTGGSSSGSAQIAWTDPTTGQGYDMYGNPVYQ